MESKFDADKRALLLHHEPPCLIGMEAYAGQHFLSRALREQARDVADAGPGREAVCEGQQE